MDRFGRVLQWHHRAFTTQNLAGEGPRLHKAESESRRLCERITLRYRVEMCLLFKKDIQVGLPRSDQVANI